jgi:hypothetical protein
MNQHEASNKRLSAPLNAHSLLREGFQPGILGFVTLKKSTLIKPLPGKISAAAI